MSDTQTVKLLESIEQAEVAYRKMAGPSAPEVDHVAAAFEFIEHVRQNDERIKQK